MDYSNKKVYIIENGEYKEIPYSDFEEHLKHEPITLDNQALRKLIDCIRVMSKDEIQIIFKSGFVRNVPLKQ